MQVFNLENDNHIKEIILWMLREKNHFWYAQQTLKTPHFHYNFAVSSIFLLRNSTTFPDQLRAEVSSKQSNCGGTSLGFTREKLVKIDNSGANPLITICTKKNSKYIKVISKHITYMHNQETEVNILKKIWGDKKIYFIRNEHNKQSDKSNAIIMPFKKNTLHNFLDTYSHPPLKRLDLFKKILCLVHSLHQKNIAHLDLKYSNIFIDDKEQLCLGDFGSAYDQNSTEKWTPKASTHFSPEYAALVRYFRQQNASLKIMQAQESLHQTIIEAGLGKQDIYALGCLAEDLFAPELRPEAVNDFKLIFSKIIFHCKNTLEARIAKVDSIYTFIVEALQKSSNPEILFILKEINDSKAFPYHCDEYVIDKIAQVVKHNPNLVKYYYDDCTLLHGAIVAKRIKVVAYLLSKGADANQTTKLLGQTPLMLACFPNPTIEEQSHLEMIPLLRRYQANIFEKDLVGNTLLDRAIKEKNTVLIDLFFKDMHIDLIAENYIARLLQGIGLRKNTNSTSSFESNLIAKRYTIFIAQHILDLIDNYLDLSFTNKDFTAYEAYLLNNKEAKAILLEQIQAIKLKTYEQLEKMASINRTITHTHLISLLKSPEKLYLTEKFYWEGCAYVELLPSLTRYFSEYEDAILHKILQNPVNFRSILSFNHGKPFPEKLLRKILTIEIIGNYLIDFDTGKSYLPIPAASTLFLNLKLLLQTCFSTAEAIALLRNEAFLIETNSSKFLNFIQNSNPTMRASDIIYSYTQFLFGEILACSQYYPIIFHHQYSIDWIAKNYPDCIQNVVEWFAVHKPKSVAEITTKLAKIKTLNGGKLDQGSPMGTIDYAINSFHPKPAQSVASSPLSFHYHPSSLTRPESNPHSNPSLQ